MRNNLTKFDYNRFRVLVGQILILLLFLISGKKELNFYALIVFAFGFLIRIWAAGYIHKDKEVTKAGPYKFLRHPLYLGSFIAGLGFVLFINIWQAIVLYIPLFLIVYFKKMQLEEQYLLKEFGDQYKHYQEVTPLFIPNLTNIKIKDNIQFCWQNVIRNKEHLNILGGIAVITLFLIRQILLKRF